MKDQRIAILLLAAGASTRMGSIKQLLPWKNQLLINHMIALSAASGCDDVLVVLGAHANTIIKALDRGNPFSFVLNPAWEEGLGATISFGVKELLGRPQKPDAILILLCDQPLVDKEYLGEMMHNFRGGHGLVATNYGKNLGVPALFGSDYFEALKELNSQYGAKDLLRQNRESCHILDAGEKVGDIDTPADYKRILDQGEN